MGRSNRPRRGGRVVGRREEPVAPARPVGGMSRRERRRDGEWFVRELPGSDKTYRCPGCSQEIAPGTAHVVVWRADLWRGDQVAVEERRHWHRGCWQRG